MIELTCQANANIGENKVAIALRTVRPTAFEPVAVMVVGNKKTVAQIVINDAAIRSSLDGRHHAAQRQRERRRDHSPAPTARSSHAAHPLPTTGGDLDDETFNAAIRSRGTSMSARTPALWSTSTVNRLNSALPR